uniref:Putative odorant-binding protein n=1 Tax=Triatoma brasiliensis TaxID=65344 RepID=A0A162REZ3_TRIBS|nr:putative odorant-binding protein [Triatoma brasiliensis]
MYMYSETGVINMKAELLCVLLTITIAKVISENTTVSDEDPETLQYINCIQKYNISGTEVPASGSYAEKCGNACAMKAKGMLTDEGEFIKDRMLSQKFQPYVTSEDIVKMQMAIDFCVKQVSNEGDECEKAYGLMDCMQTKVMESSRSMK